jgi:hypothetical protein
MNAEGLKSPDDGGVVCVGVHETRITLSGNNFDFSVRIFDCPDDDGRTLKHVFVAKPGTDKIGMPLSATPWDAVYGVFGAYVDAAEARGAVTAYERDHIARTQLLGLIGISAPMRFSGLLDRVISSSTLIRAGEAGHVRLDGDSAWRPVDVTKLGRQADPVTDRDFIQTAAAATLMGDNVGPEITHEYLQWQAKLFDDVRPIIEAAIQTGAVLEKQKADIKALIASIRKSAKRRERTMLHLLNCACEVNLMHMYQFVMEPILDEVRGKVEFDDTSWRYNRWVHAAQHRFGGLVPAIHPIWSLLLHSRPFVSVVVRATDDPLNPEALNDFNVMMAQSILLYRQLAQMDTQRRDSKETPHDPIAAEDGNADNSDSSSRIDGARANQVSEITEVLAHIHRLAKDDPDIALFIDHTLGGMSARECGQKYSIKQREVYTAVNRARRKLQAKLRSLGVTKKLLGDMFSSRTPASGVDLISAARLEGHSDATDDT